MSNFEVLVRQVDDVIDHGNADRLSIVKVLGFEAITAKLDDGSHRFQPGDEIVYVPEGAIVPEDVLKERGYWNEEKNIGMLAGKAGTRVKAIRLRGVLSQGLVWHTTPDALYTDLDDLLNSSPLVFIQNDGEEIGVTLGEDVASFFGITKWEPPIPAGMDGDVIGASEFAYNYDIENYQTYPDFLVGDQVEVTEKLHGTNFRVSYRPGVSYPDLFGDGDVAITSKGMGAKGLVLTNSEKNRVGNLYVRTALELGLVDLIHDLGLRSGESIDLFCEIYGVGVQDLHYGTTKPECRAFDVRVNGEFLNHDDKVALLDGLGIQRVPLLYVGPFYLDHFITLRDGTTRVNRDVKADAGPCIREGIVITSMGDQQPRQADFGHSLRPILKMVSPDYLTRKGGTEFN
jgi:RNA ligase (TIGR02306 family)